MTRFATGTAASAGLLSLLLAACGSSSSFPGSDGDNGSGAGGSDGGSAGTNGGGAGTSGGDDAGPTVDTSCVNMHMLEARPVQPSAVALFLSVDNCAGEPVTNLDPSRFVISEDGQPISVEASVTPIPLKGQEIFVDLLIDVSTSTAAYQAQLLAAASQFVDTVTASGAHIQIGVSAFAGDPDVKAVLTPNLNAATVKDAIASLATYKPTDANSTNLYGAITEQITSLEASAASFRSRNFGGAFTADYLLVFTAGRDTSDRVTLANTVAAIAATPATVLGVALNGPDYDSTAADAFQQIATGGVVTADPSTLSSTFTALATKMAGQFKRTYLVGYCSPARATNPMVSVSLSAPSVTQTAATATFNATSFGPGCSASVFTSCGTAECAGLGCGACDDRTDVCVPGTSSTAATGYSPPGACVNNCATAQKCHDEMLTNSAGYTETCSSVPADTACGTTCIDTTADSKNCGACGNVCGSGTTCIAGTCGCIGGKCPTKVATMTATEYSIAIANNSVYWFSGFSGGSNTLQLMAVPFGGTPTVLQSGISGTQNGPVADSHYVTYVAESFGTTGGGLTSVPVGGGAPVTYSPVIGGYAYALDGANIYAGFGTTVYKVTAGVAASEVTVGTVGSPPGGGGISLIAVDSTNVYASVGTASELAKNGMNGTGMGLNAGVNFVGKNGLYYISSFAGPNNTRVQDIMYFPLVGAVNGNPTPLLELTGANMATELAIYGDDTSIYWFTATQILRIPSTGATVPEVVADVTVNDRAGLVVDATHIYWADAVSNDVYSLER